MDKDIKALLIGFDDEQNLWGSLNPQKQSTLKEEDILRVKSEIEYILDEEMEFDDSMQDASFKADIGVLTYRERINKKRNCCYQHTYDICIRFSRFGNMVSIYSNTISNVYVNYPVDEIIEVFKRNGFVYINKEEVSEPYDGKNKEMYKMKNTWWDRFFNWI